MGKGRAPCCDKSKVKKGPWSCEEDLCLITFIQNHGHKNWRSLPKQAGLLRCGKSCRLRWINYLRPDVKRGNFTPQEEDTIVKLHQSFGNRWSRIASHLPGRTDNEIKNVWNTYLKKRLLPKLDGSPSSSSSSSVVLPHIEGKLKNNMIVEKQETSKSCSSYASNHEIYNMDWIFQFNEEPITTGKVHDGTIEIPFECDVDIWDKLDVMCAPPPSNSDHHSKLDNEGLSEFQYQKWFKYFENELLGV